MIPAKRKPQRSGIERAPQRVWPRHERFVRMHVCVCANGRSLEGCRGEIELCHVRIGTGGGTALKPPSWWTYPGCAAHHAEQHRIGEASFERKYGLDLRKIASTLARRSPDSAMKAVMSERGPFGLPVPDDDREIDAAVTAREAEWNRRTK